MGYLGLGEPSIGTLIILLGAYINRDKTFNPSWKSWSRWRVTLEPATKGDDEVENKTPQAPVQQTPWNRPWRDRDLALSRFSKTISSPNTFVFAETWPSRVLRKLPFLIEITYWAVIYLCYQSGRSYLALHLSSHTVEAARSHALQVVALERHLGIFIEQPIQAWLLQLPPVLWHINRVYSYLHLPVTITFLVGLYWLCVTRHRPLMTVHDLACGPSLYEARRRTLALSNLLAFTVFSTWPCMPPRLLDKPTTTVAGTAAASGEHFGFVDTVHDFKSAISAFNNEKFTNQLAAMPSMHFGYALLIGLSLATLPLTAQTPPRGHLRLPSPVSLISRRSRTFTLPRPSWARVMLVTVGIAYPLLILVAIVSTANHFILDAVAGAVVVGVAWKLNHLMLNLLVIEDAVLWVLRTHKPVPGEDCLGRVEPEIEPSLDGRSRSRQPCFD